MLKTAKKVNRRIWRIKRLLLFFVLMTTLVTPVGAATVTVSDCSAPSGGVGRLVEAISAADTGDTVNFSCSGMITLSSTILIDKNLDLDGEGQNVIISGGNSVRVFTVDAGITFKLQNLTVANGEAVGSHGGGIYNSGVLGVTNVTFSGNSATYGGGGIYNVNPGTLEVANSTFSGNTATYGGGISNPSTGAMNITDSIFYNNSATTDGGAFFNSSGTSNVTNSTFSGNSATYGGGINNRSSSTINVWNSTFSGNSASFAGGGVYNYGNGLSNVTNSTLSGNSAISNGGGIYNHSVGMINLKNSIVANSPAGGNCSGTITNGGGNLQFGGTVANSCGAGIFTADPVLFALGNNGGSTQTMALGPGSAAIGAANYDTCMAAVGSPNYGAGGLDQRGQPRANVNSVCDVGAFEQLPGDITPTSTPTSTLTSTPTFTPTATATHTPTFTPTFTQTFTPTYTASATPTSTPTMTPLPSLLVSDCSFPGGAAGRLVEVITAAGAGSTINFSCSGTITLAATITIDKNLTIDGAGQSVTVSGGDTVRVFTVNTGRTLNLQNLSVSHGNSPGNGNIGGGVRNSGTLNVTNVTFSGNYAGYAGGGIYSTGTLNVTNSAFSDNSAGPGFGGGIAIFNGTSNVTNSTFTGNSGTYGGGISNWNGTSTVANDTFSGNSGTYGGGLYNASTLNVINSTFSGNSTNGHGGGMYELGGTATVTHSTFSGNASSVAGTGGIFSNGSITLKNTIVANNTPWNCQFTITDGGGNLQFGGSVANSCGVTIPAAEPKLIALSDNGGATHTMALSQDSPALNVANSANCPATDQRGVERGSNCDIGAYEYLGMVTGNVSPTSGGTIALPDDKFTITFPPNAVTTSVTVTYAQVLPPAQPLPVGRIGLRYFTLEARDGGGNLVTNFDQPYTLTLTYTDAELAAVDITEGSLNLAFWNETTWVDMLPCGGCGIDTANNLVTIVANHFSDFALTGQIPGLFLPLIVR